jgi:L-lactate dehydrogenase
MDQWRSKVSVLGAGHVGSAVANALVLLRACDLVVLYDRELAQAEGQAWDIADAVPLLSEMEVVPTAQYGDLDGSDVVVVTVGPTLAAGQTRLDLTGVNAGIIAEVVRELDVACPDAVVIVVSNPVDVLTRIAIETSTRPAHLIFGCGTVLDGARLRHQLGRLLDVEDESVHAYVIGEHGDSSFPVWSSATVGAIRLAEYGLPEGTSLAQVQEALGASTRRRGISIHERKGFTSYGIAVAVARLVRAIARDEKRIFMVSVLAAREYGIGPVALSLPCVVGRTGVVRQLMLAMSAEEQQMLQNSAAVLDQAYRSISVATSQPGTGTRNKTLRSAGRLPEPDWPAGRSWRRWPGNCQICCAPFGWSRRACRRPGTTG